MGGVRDLGKGGGRWLYKIRKDVEDVGSGKKGGVARNNHSGVVWNIGLEEILPYLALV